MRLYSSVLLDSVTNYITWKVNFSESRYPKVEPKIAAYESFSGVILIASNAKSTLLR